MSTRYNNTIYKQFLKNKRIIKVILSSITKIRLIKYIEKPKEAFNINYIYIKKITIADIITTNCPIKNNITSVINLNTS